MHLCAGTRDGASSYKCVEVINAALVVLDRPKVHESILLHTLQALVVVSAHCKTTSAC